MEQIYCEKCKEVHDMVEVFVDECVEIQKEIFHYRKIYYECKQHQYLFEDDDLKIRNFQELKRQYKKRLATLYQQHRLKGIGF